MIIPVIPNTINIVHNQAKNNLDLEILFNSILISDNIDSFLQSVNKELTIQTNLTKYLKISLFNRQSHQTYYRYVNIKKQTYLWYV